MRKASGSIPTTTSRAQTMAFRNAFTASGESGCVGIHIAEARLLQSLRVSRSHTTRRQSVTIDTLARDLIQKRRYVGIRHLLEISRDAFDRGAPVKDVKAFSREFDAVVDGWYTEREGSELPSLEQGDLTRGRPFTDPAVTLT